MPAMRLVSRAVADFYTKSAFCNLIADTARPCGKCGSFNGYNYTKGKFCIIEGMEIYKKARKTGFFHVIDDVCFIQAFDIGIFT